MTPPSADGEEGEAAGFEVAADAAGQRLDAWLAGQLPAHLSRSRVKALIEAGAVSLDGRPAPPSQKLRAGQRIELVVPEAVDPEPLPEAIPLEILFEDAAVLVLVKPAGLVVHPAPGNWTGTLVNALLHHCGPSLTGIGGVRRPGIVHRLDRDTSGVMVVAKTEEALAGLAAQFADHGRTGPLERAYDALVWGVPDRSSGTIDAPLGRSPNNRLKRAVVRAGVPDAREAITHWRVAARLPATGGGLAALLDCRLETGRTHQIRVHLAHLGHPLIGDADYGAHFRTKAATLPEPARSHAAAFPRQALHARLLAFAHPLTGATLRFESPPTADLAALIASFAALD